MKKIDLVENYWLWVTGPEFYFDVFGKERSGLGPDSEFDTEDYEDEPWWTCHKDTKKGDLILLYRKTPMKDIKYLWRATSNAFHLEDKISNYEEVQEEYGWDYGCEYESLFKFEKPFKLSQMHHETFLHDWGAYKANFRRRVFKIPDLHFEKLIEIFTIKNHDFETFAKEYGPLKRFYM